MLVRTPPSDPTCALPLDLRHRHAISRLGVRATYAIPLCAPFRLLDHHPWGSMLSMNNIKMARFLDCHARSTRRANGHVNISPRQPREAKFGGSSINSAAVRTEVAVASAIAVCPMGPLSPDVRANGNAFQSVSKPQRLPVRASLESRRWLVGNRKDQQGHSEPLTLWRIPPWDVNTGDQQ
jgi:hypothetical protein